MFAIRQARLPDDKPAFLHFIMALQRYEAVFEKNRRLDDACAEEYFASLLKHAEKGMIFVAEDDEDRPVGWAVVVEDESPVFVIADERRFAYISELFVEEALRGKGVGRALIAACEEWARAHHFTTIHIAHLTGNGRAGDVYDKAGYASHFVHRRKRL